MKSRIRFLILFSLFFTLSSQDSGAAKAEWWPPLTTTTTPAPGTSVADCNRNIYRRCNQQTTFADADLRTVLSTLNRTFTMASVPPTADAPLCDAITIRRDWKCLSAAQRTRVLNAFQQLYTNGVVKNLTDIHRRYWPAWHNTGELFPAHRWLALELERYAQLVDPGLILPYWCPWTAGAHPERSIVWDAFGHNGSYSDGYCVGDGAYPPWNLIPCVKRHWTPRGTIYPWATPELDTNLLHFGSGFSLYTLGSLVLYLQPLMNAGGYEGQWSEQDAPYDVLFFLKSLCETEVRGAKWQFGNNFNAVPLSYNNIEFSLSQSSGRVEMANISADTLTGVPGVSVASQFWLGFGGQCSVSDSVARVIIQRSKNATKTLPRAITRMQPWILTKYFRQFAIGRIDDFLHTFEEVGDCNNACVPIPKPTFLQETKQGRRILDALIDPDKYLLVEQNAFNLWFDLNRSGYCSPYVTP